MCSRSLDYDLEQHKTQPMLAWKLLCPSTLPTQRRKRNHIIWNIPPHGGSILPHKCYIYFYFCRVPQQLPLESPICFHWQNQNQVDGQYFEESH